MHSFRFPTSGLLTLTALAGLVSSACEDAHPSVYTARAYRADLDCLEAYAPIGLVEAEELPASCEPTCLLVNEQIHLSSVCPPFPGTAVPTTPDESPDCEAALAALDSEVFCDAETP